MAFLPRVWVTNPLTTAEATVTIKELTPIVRLVLEPAVIAVKADSPYKNMKDVIEAAKKVRINSANPADRLLPGTTSCVY